MIGAIRKCPLVCCPQTGGGLVGSSLLLGHERASRRPASSLPYPLDYSLLLVMRNGFGVDWLSVANRHHDTIQLCYVGLQY